MPCKFRFVFKNIDLVIKFSFKTFLNGSNFLITMPDLIAWIGFNTQVKSLEMAVELELQDVGFENFDDGKSGLDAVTTREYKMIVVEGDYLPPHGLELPEGVNASARYEVGTYVVGQIRSQGLNQKTPIVVVHNGKPPEQVLTKFQKFGATECFDWYQKGALRLFAETVKKYIRQEPPK